MLAIGIIFYIVVEAAISPLLFGINDLLFFKIKSSILNTRIKNSLIKVVTIIICLVAIASIFGVWILSAFLCLSKIGNYIAVITYTLVLTILSSNAIYQSPKLEINSAGKAFKKGFTKANVNNLIANFPLKAIINLLYLVILVVAQIEDLGYCKLPENVSYFFTLNKYGIVIILAAEKIIKSIRPDKERAKILTEAFVEQEKQEDEQREKNKKAFRELIEIIKLKRQIRKDAKKQRKKDKENK